MRLIPVLFLIACGPSSPRATSATDQQAPPPSDPVAVDASVAPAPPPAEIGDVLGLTADQVALVRTYEQSARLAVTSREAGAMCSALEQAHELTVKLGDPLLARRDVLFDDPTYESFIAAVGRLSETLLGAEFAVGAATVYASVKHSAFDFAGAEATRSALAIADDLLRPWPSWMVQKTDVTGCARPASAKAVLEKLADDKAWAAAPQCLRDFLAPRLEESLSSMSQSVCFCDNKKTVTTQATTISALLEKVTAFDGKALADQLRKSAASSSARFECTPG